MLVEFIGKDVFLNNGFGDKRVGSSGGNLEWGCCNSGVLCKFLSIMTDLNCGPHLLFALCKPLLFGAVGIEKDGVLVWAKLFGLLIVYFVVDVNIDRR